CDGLTGSSQDVQRIAGKARPVKPCPDEPVAAERRYLPGQRGRPLEVLLLKLATQPFFALYRFEPGAEVFAGGGTDLQYAEGSARTRLPFEIDDRAGDRHVIFHQLQRQLAASVGRDVGWEVGPTRAKAVGLRHHRPAGADLVRDRQTITPLLV